LRNGSILGRINWPGDTTLNGIRQSYGVMVNYQYAPLADHTANNNEYTRRGGIATLLNNNGDGLSTNVVRYQLPPSAVPTPSSTVTKQSSKL
jgi:hypothetical protein